MSNTAIIWLAVPGAFMMGTVIAVMMWIIDWREPDRPGLGRSIMIVGGSAALLAAIVVALVDGE